MIDISSQDFEVIVAAAMDAIPEHYRSRMNNVAFVIEDSPSASQRQRLHLVDGVLLYGLYEGVPLTERRNNYSGVLPDKITIFRLPILTSADSRQAVEKQVQKTVWHEVAHHFGLGHDRIYDLEK